MLKASKPIDIPLRASKKKLVGIGQNLLSKERGSVELIVGKPTHYSKSVKEEIETDKIDISSPSLESNSFKSLSSLQNLPLAEEVSVPKELESEGFSALLAPLSASNKENITLAPPLSVTVSESVEETQFIPLHAVSKPIPSASEAIMSMVSESLDDDASLIITGSDKNSDLGISSQSTDLEINQKSLEQGSMQEEQETTTLGEDVNFIFQLDE